MQITEESLIEKGFTKHSIAHFKKDNISVTLYSWDYVIFNKGGAMGTYRKGYKLTMQDLREFSESEPKPR